MTSICSCPCKLHRLASCCRRGIKPRPQGSQQPVDQYTGSQWVVPRYAEPHTACCCASGRVHECEAPLYGHTLRQGPQGYVCHPQECCSGLRLSVIKHSNLHRKGAQGAFKYYYVVRLVAVNGTLLLSSKCIGVLAVSTMSCVACTAYHCL